MNYASIESWLDLFRDCFVGWEEWERIAPTSTSTASSFLAQLSAESISVLKSITKMDGAVAESANLTWWLGQTLKKFRHGCDISKKETYTGFLNRNNLCRNREVPWFLRKRMEVLISNALKEFDRCCDKVDGRFGPGAVAEKLTNIQKWQVLSDFSYDARSMTLIRSGAWSQIASARLCCVPKSFDKYRLITIEPVEQSFGQQYVRRALINAIHIGPLRGTVMDLANSHWDDTSRCYRGGTCEQIQRKRCIGASQCGSLATLDLSDASDSISWDQVVQVFPVNVIAMLERFRTPSVSLPLHGKAEQLHMYAGMGNATTFVVETLYFWALVTSISEWLGDLNTPVTVFGDDIICSNRIATNPLFEDTLRRAGLSINWTKSGVSLTPGFRESCGVTALCGTPLEELIRIYGFDLKDEVSQIDACSFVNKVADRAFLRLPNGRRMTEAQLNVTDSLISSLILEHAVPNLPRLESEALALSLPWLPISETVPASFRIDGGIIPPEIWLDEASSDWSADLPVGRHYNADLSCYQRLAYKVSAKRQVQESVLRSHLSPSEALGVMNGQITTLPSKRKRTRLSIPTREVTVRKCWVNTL